MGLFDSINANFMNFNTNSAQSEQSGSDDLKLIKFKELIAEVDLLLCMKYPYYESSPTGGLLKTVFDISNLNERGQIICNNTKMRFYSGTYFTPRLKSNIGTREDAIADILRGVKNDKYGYITKHHLMFWALMILTVDETDKDKRLSDICDYARILGVTDEEMLDIASIVRYVVKDETILSVYTESVEKNFCYIWNLYSSQ